MCWEHMQELTILINVIFFIYYELNINNPTLQIRLQVKHTGLYLGCKSYRCDYLSFFFCPILDCFRACYICRIIFIIIVITGSPRLFSVHLQFPELWESSFTTSPCIFALHRSVKQRKSLLQEAEVRIINSVAVSLSDCFN